MIDVLVASVDDVHALADRLGHAVPGSGRGARAFVDDLDWVAATSRLRAEDSRRTLAGRVALRMLAATTLGRPLSDAALLEVDRTCTQCGAPHGQPRIAGLSVSSSTSGSHVLVAVGDAEARVGVDVEVVLDELWTGFDSYVLHPEERDTMPEGAEGVSARIRAWAEKEAVLKAVGLGLRGAPARLRISAVETPGGWPSGAGLVDPGAWRPVSSMDVRAVSGMWVTSLTPGAAGDAAHGGDDAWSILAASMPQPIRRWSTADLVGLATAGAPGP